ncbi:MAG: ABC transporter ATP-binding protein [Chloroflexi bacterium]|nr:ABC transporter ATP-binding protein [Chloroflexota bacterium]
MAVDTVIQVRDMVKRFGEVEAVRGVSFEVHGGEVFGILGPNGAGKTTTLETIEGLLQPTSGRTEVLGMDVRQHPKEIKERIGVQLQASAYFEYLTLTEILKLFGSFYRRRLSPQQLLETVDLVDKANSTLGKLSGGQKQRFTLAASLVNDPELVILDEPTTGLDPQARRSIWEFIQEIHRQGRTIVLTTHYMEEAQTLCQRVAIMDAGVIVALDTPANLVRRLPVPYRIHVGSEGPLPLDELRGLEAVQELLEGQDGDCYLLVTDPTAALTALLAWARERSIHLEHLEVLSATLEDVFLELTGNELRE